jgi:hypothetical protein
VNGQIETTSTAAPGTSADRPDPSRTEGQQPQSLDEGVSVQVERVETLLAAVRDIVSSLGATSAQLEREVAQALRPSATPSPHGTGTGPSPHGTGTGPTPHGTGTAHTSGGHIGAGHGKGRGHDGDALEAERAALVEAVEHRAVIEQAKGMLMLKHRCDADEAFGLLLEISRREHRKVREIAADLVRAGSAPRPVVDLTAHNGGAVAPPRP